MGKGVELTRSVGTMDGSLIHLAAQLAVSQCGEDGLLGGIDNHDAIRRLATATLGILLALGNISVAQTYCQLLFVSPTPPPRW